jgi:hypothetical protein
MLRRYLLESEGNVPFQHLHTVRHRLRDPSISGYELVECAKMLLLSHANGVDIEDEYIGADWMSRINIDLKLRDS